jgi:nitroreductase
MSGIVFFATRELEALRSFYTGMVGMREWLDQGDCVILAHGNLKVGFHATGKADVDALITIVYPDRAGVDEAHTRLAAMADAPPKHNERYRIYHFFAGDPEGRRLEFQSFEHEIEPVLDAEELLRTRRSVRQFAARKVDETTIGEILDSCRFAPSARNTQPVEFVLIQDREALRRLSDLRPGSSDPIGRAPLAVAIVSDPAISPRPVEDGCIAAYHLLLAAWAHGLGTCWIGGLDQDAAKQILGIPENHHLVTVTPVGWPDETPPVRPRREVHVRRV